MAKEIIHIEISEVNLHDEQVFKSLFNSYFPRVYNFARQIIQDDMVCDDIVQDAFLYMWQKNPCFNDVLAFKSYLYSCVKNRCLNYLRDHKIEIESDELKDIFYDDAILDHLMIEQELRAYILNSINKLPEMKRNVMLLRLEGNSYEEISEALSLSINTIKSHKKQAYRELKLSLSDYQHYIMFLLLLALI